MISLIYKSKVIRYITSGGTAASVSVGLLFILTHYAKLWYIFSAIIAYSIAFIVSFTLQKLWTFKNMSTLFFKKQILSYFTIFIVSNTLNTVLLYVFVEYFYFHYIGGQIVSNGLIALINFFVYRDIIFAESDASIDASAKSRS